VFLLYHLVNWILSFFTVPISKKSVFITGCDSGFGRGLAVKLD